jgi:hypothetical protein
LVSTLVREAYLPRPGQKSGMVVEAIADAGFFRLRGVLVGTLAYQCYPALLGVRLPDTAMITSDADFALFHAVANSVEDRVEPLLEKLRNVDPTFRAIPHQIDGRFATQLVAKDGFRIDFLTPNTSSEDYAGRPATMPALGGIAAQPLRFLDYLIAEPQRAVLLYGAGVPVLVPTPQRFAIHKLIVASRRLADDNGIGKSNKDRRQAITLMQALIETRRTADLAEAYMEAWERGPHWQEAIRKSIGALDDFAGIASELAVGIAGLGGAAADYGLSGGALP